MSDIELFAQFLIDELEDAAKWADMRQDIDVSRALWNLSRVVKDTLDTYKAAKTNGHQP